MFQKILLPLDLTDKHRAALDTAAELARQNQGELLLLHVVEVIPGLSGEEEQGFYQRLQQVARTHLGRLAAALTKKKCPCGPKSLSASASRTPFVLPIKSKSI